MDRPTPLRLTRAQAREVDRIAIERYGLPGIVLMENAARAAVDVAVEMLRDAPPAARGATILCGGGNNGGDGLAIARHLHNRGWAIDLRLTLDDPDQYAGDARINWRITRAMNLPWLPATPNNIARQPLIIDAIFGTGLSREPRPPFPALAAAINAAGRPILSIDLPSGLDADTGVSFGPCVRATKTITFAAPKQGFDNPLAAQYVGELHTGDIGCPPAALRAAIESVR